MPRHGWRGLPARGLCSVTHARRAETISRGLDFLETHEPLCSSRVDCDWMLGAAVTAEMHRRSHPAISTRAAAMAARLVARWTQRPAPPLVSGRGALALFRRRVLDTFAATRAHSAANLQGDLPLSTVVPEIDNAIVTRAVQWAHSEHGTIERAMFGFCPLTEEPCGTRTGRTEWSNAIIFACMAGSCNLEPIPGNPVGFSDSLQWVQSALQSHNDDEQMWQHTAAGQQLRQQELYLQTHILYTVCSYQHSAGFGSLAEVDRQQSALAAVRALHPLLRRLLTDAATLDTRSPHMVQAASSAPSTFDTRSLRFPDMIGEAVDCLKFGHDVLAVSLAIAPLIHEAENFLVNTQEFDGGWAHDEGRRHHATFVALWALR